MKHIPSWCPPAGGSRAGVATHPDTVRAPDVGFARAARLASMPNASDYFAGPPDLAIEVVWPSDLYTEVDEKIADWLAAGCQAVVVIDPRRRRATVHRRDAAVVSLGSADSLVLADLLPGWSLPLGEVFTVQPSS